MAVILLIFIIFPCHCAVYRYKIMILQKPLSQISHWSYCWNVIDSLFKWLCSIDCQAHIFFFKTKNCSNDDLFIGCDDRIGKMLHNICISAVVMSLRWASRGPWASCSIVAGHNDFMLVVPVRICCISVHLYFRFRIITCKYQCFFFCLVYIYWYCGDLIGNGQISSVFIPSHMIVAEYYGILSSVCPSVRTSFSVNFSYSFHQACWNLVDS